MHARETILILSEEFSLYSSEVTLADDDDVRNITHPYLILIRIMGFIKLRVRFIPLIALITSPQR